MKIPSTIISLSIPLSLLKQVDKKSQEKLMTRSELVKNALIIYLDPIK